MSLLAGLLVLTTVMIAGITAVVYVRAHRRAHEAMRRNLELRANTLAGMLEVSENGIEFDVPQRVTPEYQEPGSGAYAAIYDAGGKAVVRSPSLGEQPLPVHAAWRKDEYVFEDIAAGPDGFPCATITLSFLARVEKSRKPDRVPPTDEERRYQIRVALDSRERDESLLSLALFLAITAAAALGLTLVGGLLVARRVLRPVRKLTEEAGRLTPTDPSRRLEPDTVVRELHSLATTLYSALDRLADALARQRRFTSDAGHELRTPVSVLLGNAELLLRRPRTAGEYREGLERQLRIALRMRDITENLLTLARADSPADGLQREVVSPGDLLESVCDEFRMLAREREVAIHCRADESVRVCGDRGFLGLLVQNLLSNAIKFTPRGGRVDLELESVNGEAILTVADTGPGIPADERRRVFDRFHRVNEGRDRREGAGLGLAIVALVARSHGGSVTVAGRPGSGAAFEVRLPLCDACPDRSRQGGRR